MTAKEWLNRARRLEEIVQTLEAEKAQSFSRAVGCVPSADDERVQTSRRNASENAFVAYAEYSRKLDECIDELYNTKREIVAVIWAVKDNTLRLLLFRRYIRCQTWERIAEEMHYSFPHVVGRLHPKALAEVEEILNNAECRIIERILLYKILLD